MKSPANRPLLRFQPAAKRNAFLFSLLTTLLAAWTGPVVADPSFRQQSQDNHVQQLNEDNRYYNDAVSHGLNLGNCNRVILGGTLDWTTGAGPNPSVNNIDGGGTVNVGDADIRMLVGGVIGQHMDSVDQNCVGQILEHTPDGQGIGWRNPDNAFAYLVMPETTFQTADGRACRNYIAKAWIDGQQQQVFGTACRQPDGSWEVARI